MQVFIQKIIKITQIQLIVVPKNCIGITTLYSTKEMYNLVHGNISHTHKHTSICCCAFMHKSLQCQLMQHRPRDWT